MMTNEATPESATAGDGPARVPWRSLYRNTYHRTSAPTNEAVRSAAWTMQQARRGTAPFVDAVILAALRIAAKDPAAWHAEVELVESETFVDDERYRTK